MDLVDYGKCFIGVPYVWGGSHPAQGYDCSGFVQELLASKGLDPAGDQTADALHDKLISEGYANFTPTNIERNDILFFGDNRHEKYTHTAIAVDEFTMLEAGGGGSKTKNINDSIRDQAMVRIRPIRSDLKAVLRPSQLELL